MRPPSDVTMDTIPPAGDDGDTAAEPDPPLPSSTAQQLSLDIVEEAGDWSGFGAMDAVLAPVIAAASRHIALQDHWPADVCLALGDDQFVQILNRDFRQIDKPTNVLSFPAPPPPPGTVKPGERRQLGDIVLALDTVLREADEQAVAPADHIRHLVLHGLLHLVGYDHETDAEAHIMEALEIEILGQIGIANPYTQELALPAQVVP